MNIRVALEVFLERVRGVAVRPGFTPGFQAGMTRRTTSLEIVFDERASR